MKFRAYGHVKDSTTGKAVTGIIIKIYLNKEEIQQGKSAENGFYELIAEIDDSRIESGQQLKLTFEKEGYKTQENLVLATEGAFNLDIALEMADQPHFNWKPIIIAGIALLVILVGGAIAWWLISRPAPPKIINFSVDPNPVMVGTSAMLSWETSNALNVLINPNIGSVDISGSKAVSPLQTTTYTIIAKNEKGKMVEKMVQLQVSIPPPPPQIAFFEASPIAIKKGEQSTLSWETLNALNVLINPNIGSVNMSGSKVVSPLQTTTYTIIAKNEKGKMVEKIVQVQVSIPPPPKIAFFKASPTAIKNGEQSTLSWETSNAVDVKIRPDVGDVRASGSKAVSPKQTTNYTLIVKNKEGTSVEGRVKIQVALAVSDFQNKSTYPDISGVYSGHIISRVSGDIYRIESPQGTWHWVGCGIYWKGFMLGVGRFTHTRVPGRSFFLHMDMRGNSVISKMVYLTDGSSEANLNNLPSGIRVDQHLLSKH